jgi:probable HAF family extracellular repeat protein
MKLKLATSLTVIIVLFAALVFPSQLPAQDKHDRYRVFNLGNLSGTASEGNTINNIGWAIGAADQSGNITEHATVWIYGLRFDLGTLGGPNSDVQWPNKNNHGQIAGFSETAALDPYNESWSCTAFTPTAIPTGHVCTGFVWQFGVMNPLPTLGGNNGFASGENNLGQIVGWAETQVHDSSCVLPQVLQFLPVLYGPGLDQITALPTYVQNGVPDPDGAATAINDNGQIVGISGTCDVAVGAFTAMHALLWENGNVINLGNLGGQGWNTPMAINHRGDTIVGFSDLPGDVVGGVLSPNFHAFVWTEKTGKMTDIGVLPGDSLSEALDVNDQGQVVGVSLPSFHAFIYENGKMFDLNSFVPKSSALLLIAANGINEKGEITGQACVISDGACPLGANIPAFLAIPDYHAFGEADAGADSDSETTNPDAASTTASEGIRQQMMRKIALGHFAAEKVKPEPTQ